jgi:hypothetical protein
MSCHSALVPKLLFGNAVRETPVSRREQLRFRPDWKQSFQACLPKQEFGNEVNLR